MFENKTITVFGIGTIGSLIIEYLKKQNPYAIRVCCNSDNELWEARNKWGSEGMRYLYRDIRDVDGVKRAVHKTDYVFNTAALKHIDICEYNPIETVKTNIFGLENIITACIEKKVKKFLHVSTDKAVEPSCVMGDSKALGEKLLQERWRENPKIGMVTVRLGNVQDSRGSLIPLINEYKKQNKPFPLTSPDMTRYFMSPEEVIDFIILAFKEGGMGEIFIPKLKIVNILDVIRDYPYEIVGIRKGEKISEKLITEEELRICVEKKKYWIIENELKNRWMSKN